MSEELVDAIIVAHKFVGPDFVIVRLEDGTEIKITINCQVVKAKDEKNPDGTPKYHFNINVTPTVKPPIGKTIKVPKSAFGQPQPPPKPKDSRQVA